MKFPLMSRTIPPKTFLTEKSILSDTAGFKIVFGRKVQKSNSLVIPNKISSLNAKKLNLYSTTATNVKKR